ncbi:PE-PPE domain-containing protein [Mycolicibacterium flavescens]|uniref:PE-PPE domain-containing protein n=1 Tax=Mycolicibacterium flavescens TaxID=1776 RepID=UPI0013F4F1CE|nr:PE-PPE domain-containing protein [Mycolicibacterium flavescens]MCV7281825.1 PE-PPE domain-containing protein [Mycolicibacterium flavescens]
MIVLFFLSLLSTAVLGVVAALLSAVSLAATALIVPGTGTPDANVVDKFKQNAQTRYIAPFSNCDDATCVLDGINYPASFFPLVIFPGWCEPGRCETWNTSVGIGVDHLYTALDTMEDPEGFTLFGYSQGGAVVSNTLRRIAKDNPDLLDKINSVVMIGNAYNPDGGLFTRLGFLPTIPFLNITFGPATPTDLGVEMTTIGFQYDPVMYAPLYWGNPLALFNAFAAFDNVHGYYLTPNGKGPNDPMAYGYDDTELADILASGCPGAYCRVDEFDNKYYMIPAKSLPMMNLIMSAVPEPLRPFVKPLVDLTSPAAKVLIDLAYNWSGDPGQTRWLSILPFSPTTNWLKVGVDLAVAVVQGISDAINGGATIAIPAEEVETLAATSSQRSGRSAEITGEPPKPEPVPESVDEGTDDGVKDDGLTGDDGAKDDDVDGTEDDEAVDDEVVDEEVGDEEVGDDVITDPEGVEDEDVTDNDTEDIGAEDDVDTNDVDTKADDAGADDTADTDPADKAAA